MLVFAKDERKVLLVKHKKLEVWIYPGGHMEGEENPLECAIRETKEETGSSFNVISTSNVSIQALGVETMPQPLIIMKERVPYKGAYHQHFDMIYLGIANSMDFYKNDESSDCNWFSEDDIENLKTYDNVKEIIKLGFRTLDEISSRKTG